MTLLTFRQLLQEEALAIENDIRGLLRNFGLKVGLVGASKFEVRIKQLVGDRPHLVDIMDPLTCAEPARDSKSTEAHQSINDVKTVACEFRTEFAKFRA